MKFLLLIMALSAQVGFGQETSTSFALDTKGGGGGDASEMRVNEIRTDLLKWINDGGSKYLKLPAGIPLEEYNSKMKQLLQPKFTRVAFVQNAVSKKEELTVDIDGSPKTCRGFFSKKDKKPTILCVISRFQNTGEADQYRLIHHEYAGLAMLERNDGIESDYEISKQITSFLQEKSILRLTVKKIYKTEPVNYSSCKVFIQKKGDYKKWCDVGGYNNYCSVYNKKYPKEVKKALKELKKVIKRKGYQLVHNSDDADWNLSLRHFYYKDISYNKIDKSYFDTFFFLTHKNTGYYETILAEEHPAHKKRKSEIVTHNKNIQEKIYQAKSVSVQEVAKWQSKLLPMKYDHIKVQRLSESLFNNFPTCSEALGK